MTITSLLPPGWTGELFASTYELNHTDGRHACIPMGGIPHNKNTAAWWRKAIAEAIAEATRK